MVGELIDVRLWCVFCRALRFFVRFEIVTCMGCVLMAVGCLFFEALERKLNDSAPLKGYKNRTI